MAYFDQVKDLENTFIFFDLDETLIYPFDAPFIHGLPKTHAYIEKFKNSCNDFLFKLNEIIKI